MKPFLLLCTLLIVGCEYDSGSSSYSKAYGKELAQQCIQDNVSNLDAYSTAEVGNGIYELSRDGVISTLKLDTKDGKVTGYSLHTKTVKSQDEHLHKQIEESIIGDC